MSWSVYSNFVGGVFGAPLAIEGLAAFMLEATFLGLWIFGWDRLAPSVHLATIWIAALGTWLSAYLILVANSWMQHPVGYKIVDGKAQLTQPRRAAHEPLRADRVAAHDPRRPDLRLDRHARRLVLALPARAQRRALPPRREARADRRRPGDARPAVGRQPLRGGGHQRTGHEDRRVRGAVEHLRAVRVLGLPDRRVLARRTPTRASRSRSRGCCPGWRPGRSTARSRASTSCRPASRSSSGPGNYMPRVRLDVLVDAGDGDARRGDVPDRRRRRVAVPASRRSTRRGGSCGPRSSRSPSRTSPPPPAGSSPRWAASRGSCRTC